MVVLCVWLNGLCGNNYSSRPRPPPQNVRNKFYVIGQGGVASALARLRRERLFRWAAEPSGLILNL
jgi:hypothetical protein